MPESVPPRRIPAVAPCAHRPMFSRFGCGTCPNHSSAARYSGSVKLKSSPTPPRSVYSRSRSPTSITSDGPAMHMAPKFRCPAATGESVTVTLTRSEMFRPTGMLCPCHGEGLHKRRDRRLIAAIARDGLAGVARDGVAGIVRDGQRGRLVDAPCVDLDRGRHDVPDRIGAVNLAPQFDREVNPILPPLLDQFRDRHQDTG